MSNRPFEERKADYLKIVDAARKLSIPHPEVIAAQWTLESDWGDKQLGNITIGALKQAMVILIIKKKEQ
ncbi:hypothetical protein ACLQ91_09745 [Avibacterium endocarditidis]|uniref:hypothetical protein n=1 Tax=Avibacterium endocarditidis TaxID=380674 RepID=UPI0039FD3FBD